MGMACKGSRMMIIGNGMGPLILPNVKPWEGYGGKPDVGPIIWKNCGNKFPKPVSW